MNYYKVAWRHACCRVYLAQLQPPAISCRWGITVVTVTPQITRDDTGNPSHPSHRSGVQTCAATARSLRGQSQGKKTLQMCENSRFKDGAGGGRERICSPECFFDRRLTPEIRPTHRESVHAGGLLFPTKSLPGNNHVTQPNVTLRANTPDRRDTTRFKGRSK